MLRITDDYEGGAVENVRFPSPETIGFQAPLEGSPQGMAFAFCIREGRDRRLTFVQENVTEMLGWGGYGAVLPVVREGAGGEWRRLDPSAVEWDPETKRFQFTLTPETDETYVASCYPYGRAEFRAFLSPYRSSPFLRADSLCKTGEGMEFPLLRLEDPQSRHPRELCVFIARQHAGEVPGSFVLEGIIDAFLSETEAGDWCRSHLVFLVAPFVDLDGVVRGRYGKDRPPRDFNRDWCTRPVHPEIRALIPAIDEAAQRYPYRLFVDLHAPAPGDVSFWLPSRLSYGTPQWDETWTLGKRLEEYAPEDCPARVEDYSFSALNWSQELYEQTSTYYQALRYGVHAATLETTYHRHAGGGYVTPGGWRGLGRALVNALVQHLQEGRTDPAPTPESWGNPPPHIQGWTLPAVPRGAGLQGISPTRIKVNPLDTDPFAWFTCDRFFIRSEIERNPIRVLFDDGEAATGNIEVIVYFYDKGLPTGERRHLYLEPGTETLIWQGTKWPSVWDSVRFSFRITKLTGPMEVVLESSFPDPTN
ncbi:MAG: hypothetical protein KY468_15035 [Armatimonadetes bacterium]|nr:hypothetical protein [Armatimonadota bacterium]